MKCDFDESSYAGCSLVERHERQPLGYVNNMNSKYESKTGGKSSHKQEPTFDSKVANTAELAWMKELGVNGNTVIHATRHKTDTTLPDSWIFHDFKIGNECLSCPNGIKVIKNETLTDDQPYIVGLVLCTSTEFQIFLSEKRNDLASMFYPISVDSPNDSPCELIGETGGNSIAMSLTGNSAILGGTNSGGANSGTTATQSVAEKYANLANGARFAGIMASKVSTFSKFAGAFSASSFHQLDIKSCNAQLAYKRIKANQYIIKQPEYRVVFLKCRILG